MLLSIPCLILAGNLMNRGAITLRIIRLASAPIGRVRGGLAPTNIAASTLFGSSTGTAVANVVFIGGGMIPGNGIDPMHLASFGVLNLMIGLTTPPVDVCLFVCANIARIQAFPNTADNLPWHGVGWRYDRRGHMFSTACVSPTADGPEEIAE